MYSLSDRSGIWQWIGGPGGWGEVDNAESIRAIQVALANGINFFDTAANYGTGHSERILGQALIGRRQQAASTTCLAIWFSVTPPPSYR